MKRFVFIIITFLAAFGAIAKEFTWNVDFTSVFDNREGDRDYVQPDTYIFTRLAPEIGVKFTPRDRIAGGVVWKQPIGIEWKDYRISPTLYYRHSERLWSLSMGMFPRTQLHEELPGFLWSDSLAYNQANIRGVLAQYHSDDAFVDLYLDWRSLRSEEQREAFNIVLHGQWQPQQKPFLVGGHVMMNHLALTRHATPDQNVVDDMLINPYVGLDFSHKTALDSLRVRAGALITLDRDRGDMRWHTPAGFWIDLQAQWRWLGVRNTLYAGGNQQPMSAKFGTLLYPGEPYFQGKFYDRADVYAYIVRNKWVDLAAELNFHFSPHSFMFYQRLCLRVFIGQRL